MTLTEMLLTETYNSDARQDYEESIGVIKEVFKNWLKTVGLTDCVQTPESIRRLLITLVDEP